MREKYPPSLMFDLQTLWPWPLILNFEWDTSPHIGVHFWQVYPWTRDGHVIRTDWQKGNSYLPPKLRFINLDKILNIWDSMHRLRWRYKPTRFCPLSIKHDNFASQHINKITTLNDNVVNKNIKNKTKKQTQMVSFSCNFKCY